MTEEEGKGRKTGRRRNEPAGFKLAKSCPLLQLRALLCSRWVGRQLGSAFWGGLDLCRDDEKDPPAGIGGDVLSSSLFDDGLGKKFYEWSWRWRIEGYVRR